MIQDYQKWLNYRYLDRASQQALAQMTEEQIEDAFWKDLSFGTGGLRGKLGLGSNRMNFYTVARASRGLAKFILQEENPSCAISYDSRNYSKDFAELSAATLASLGVRVYLYNRLMPTPMLSYAVRALGTTAGIMITASHNPAEYNGYKVYDNKGCQITLEMAEEILALIEQERTLVERFPSFAEYLEKGQIHYISEEFIEQFYQEIQKLALLESPSKIKVVYSPLHGAGYEPVGEILKRLPFVEYSVVEAQSQPDGNFPTCPYPNPEEPDTMQMAAEQAKKEGADIFFATDPDCDRIGVGLWQAEDCRLLNGNELGLLMLDYILKHKDTSGFAKVPIVIKTIVSSDLVFAMAKKYGLEVRETLTGFKFIGEQLNVIQDLGEDYRYVLGFEESYGYLSGTHVRDKDAVNAALLVCELTSYHKGQGRNLLDVLETLYAEYGYLESELRTVSLEGKSGMEQMQVLMQALRADLSSIQKAFPFVERRVDYENDETGLPKSDVLSLIGEKAKILVRPSGTEPKLKFYLSAQAENREAALEEVRKLGKMVDGFLS